MSFQVARSIWLLTIYPLFSDFDKMGSSGIKWATPTIFPALITAYAPPEDTFTTLTSCDALFGIPPLAGFITSTYGSQKVFSPREWTTRSLNRQSIQYGTHPCSALWDSSCPSLHCKDWIHTQPWWTAPEYHHLSPVHLSFWIMPLPCILHDSTSEPY